MAPALGHRRSSESPTRRSLPGWIAVAVCSVALVTGIRLQGATVFAAASLTDALKEVAAVHQKGGGGKVVFNFAGSNVLARQIEAGAPADIFFSADDLQMDRVQRADLVVAGTRQAALSNTLVVVVSGATVSVPGPEGLTNAAIHRIALADPKAVPAGVYAKQALECLGLWKEIEGKVVPTENVRAALAAVESGNVEAGIVYRTDAALSKSIQIACEIRGDCGPAITYPVALLKDAPDPEGAKKFLAFMRSAEAGAIFRRFGFGVNGAQP